MFKKTSRMLTAGFFRFLLFFLALLAAFVIVFGTPAYVKKALKTSGIYNVLVDAAADSAEDKARKNKDHDASNVSFDQPEIRAAAKKAFPPSLLQSSSESALDGLYGWLDQKTTTPEFTVDLAGPKDTFANGVGDFLANRIQGLPDCTLAQLEAIGGELDLFKIPCKPVGIDIAAQRQKVVNDLTNNKEFLDKTTLSAQDLPKDQGGQTVVEQLSELPKAWRWLKIAPWILGGLALLSGIGMVLLHEDRRKALRSVGLTFVSIGALLAISFWLINFVFDRFARSDSFVKSDSPELQRTASILTRQLSNDYARSVLIFALGYVVIGAIVLGIWWWLNKKSPSIPETADKTHKPSTPAQLKP